MVIREQFRNSYHLDNVYQAWFSYTEITFHKNKNISKKLVITFTSNGWFQRLVRTFLRSKHEACHGCHSKVVAFMENPRIIGY